MADDAKKTKAAPVPKAEGAVKSAGASSPPAAKTDPKPEAKAETKTDAGDTAPAAASNYSRGEGQKPVTAAYKENWNTIFGKKKATKAKPKR